MGTLLSSARLAPVLRPAAPRSPLATDRALVKAIEAVTENEKGFWSQPLEYDRRGAGHRFFQYPAMMLPVVQQKLVQLIKDAAPNTRTMLDPFMGSGTALVAGMLNGLDCYGQDINPLSILLAKVKTSAFDHAAYQQAAIRLNTQVAADKKRKLECEFNNWNKWFKRTVAREVSKLVRSIRAEKEPSTRQLFWVTLAETIRLTSNDRTSTFKLHARTPEDIAERDLSPIEVFRELLTQNIADIVLYANQLATKQHLQQSKYVGNVCISVLDSSKDIKQPTRLPENSALEIEVPVGFDLLVSSPPYGDNRTTVPYGQHAYLPLQWIDFEDIDSDVSRDCLATTHEIDKRSLGGRQHEVTSEEQTIFCLLSPALKANVEELQKLQSTEIKKVICFVRDLDKVLKRCARVMKPNGYTVWTIGNRRVSGIEIKNNLILADLLTHHGMVPVHTIERTIQSKRMAYRNKSTDTMAKEQILIFRKK